MQKINQLKFKYILLGSVALLNKRKGLDQIICALKKLPNQAFIIVGDEKEKNNLIELIKNENIDERV